MSFEALFETMHKLVVGQIGPADAALELGLDPASPDGRRLQTYRHAYVHAVLESANVTFPVTRRVIEASAGVASWIDLVTAFGTQHPPREIRFGTAGFVEFLGGSEAHALRLPPWTGELADLELTERRIYFAPDAPPQCVDHPVASGPCPRTCLRVTNPLALRTYRYDVLPVRRATDPTTLVPDEAPTVMAIWRFRDGERRSKPLFPLPLRVVQEISRHGSAAVAGPLESAEFPRDRTVKVLRHLLEIGLLVGELPAR